MGLPSSQLDHPLFITYMLLFALQCSVNSAHNAGYNPVFITCMLLFALQCTMPYAQCKSIADIRLFALQCTDIYSNERCTMHNATFRSLLPTCFYLHCSAECTAVSYLHCIEKSTLRKTQCTVNNANPALYCLQAFLCNTVQNALICTTIHKVQCTMQQSAIYYLHTPISITVQCTSCSYSHCRICIVQLLVVKQITM